MHGDVSAAARVLFRLPPEERAEACADMIDVAKTADRFRSKIGRVHAKLGNGSLMAVARKRPMAAEPSFDNADYCRCFALVLHAIASRS